MQARSVSFLDKPPPQPGDKEPGCALATRRNTRLVLALCPVRLLYGGGNNSLNCKAKLLHEFL
jgi:hypothetical protein